MQPFQRLPQSASVMIILMTTDLAFHIIDCCQTEGFFCRRGHFWRTLGSEVSELDKGGRSIDNSVKWRQIDPYSDTDLKHDPLLYPHAGACGLGRAVNTKRNSNGMPFHGCRSTRVWRQVFQFPFCPQSHFGLSRWACTAHCTNCAMEAKSLTDKTAKLLGARVQTRSMELVLLPMALQVCSAPMQCMRNWNVACKGTPPCISSPLLMLH